MAVEQMNISISPKMAKFIRGKVKAGGYTNISEVVRTAVRRMQEEEAREARLARAAADGMLDELTDREKASWPAPRRMACLTNSPTGRRLPSASGYCPALRRSSAESIPTTWAGRALDTWPPGEIGRA